MTEPSSSAADLDTATTRRAHAVIRQAGHATAARAEACLRSPNRRHRSGWRTAAFALGLALVAVATSPPMRYWAHHDLRGHALQHLLLGMFAPLLLVLAAPATRVLRALPAPTARRLVRLLRSRGFRASSHPLAALTLDAGMLYLLVSTPLYAAILGDPRLHTAMQLHFLVAGCLFTWSIIRPDPAPHAPSFHLRLAVLAIAIALHSTLAKLMYARGWPPGTGADPAEIRAAAQVMYYGGDIAELALAAALFASWYRRRARHERHPHSTEPVTG